MNMYLLWSAWLISWGVEVLSAYCRIQTIYEIRILFRIPAMIFDGQNLLMKTSQTSKKAFQAPSEAYPVREKLDSDLD